MPHEDMHTLAARAGQAHGINAGGTPAEVDLGCHDTANADRFARLANGRARYVNRWGVWIAWVDAGHWVRDDQAVIVAERAKEVGRKLLRLAADEREDHKRRKLAAWGTQSLSATKIRAMIDLARGIDGIPIDHEELDANPWLLGVLNGVIDLRSGILRPAEPSDLITLRAPVIYDANARAPRWRQAMREWFPDEATRLYVQRLAGAALVGEQRDHIFVIHNGTGGNGKGTFTRAMQRTLGPYAVTPHMNLLVNAKHGEHDTIKASLFRARLAIASETDKRVKLAEASVKNLTGRDRISCRRLYENPWEFTPSHSLWLQTNYLPEIAGRDAGIWRRIRVVPWTATFQRAPQQAAATDLDDALAAEAPGVLRWLIDGCLAWQQDGLAEPEAVIRATLAYRESEDVFARFASDTGLAFDHALTITPAALTDALETWANTEGVRIVRRDFADWLKEHGAARLQRRMGGKREWLWAGVGIPDITSVTAVTESIPSFPIERALA